MVDLIDTNGVKPTLKKGVLGYDDYNAGGDAGRLYVGTGTASIAQAKKSEVDSHTSNVSNPHSVTKTQVGLGNVDNTSDANKPVSTATQTALNTKVDKITSTNNALPKFNGTTGALQNSNIINDASGNVGIGTSDPDSSKGRSLHIYNDTSTGTVTDNTSVVIESATRNAVFSCKSNNNGSIQLVNLSGTPVAQMNLHQDGSFVQVLGNGIGYGTGSGGTVTQLTSKSTAVTLNKPTGRITMNNAALAAGASVTFTFNNSLLTAQDFISLTMEWNVTTAYRIEQAAVGTGTALIRVTNISGSSLSEAIQIKFNIIKGAIS